MEQNKYSREFKLLDDFYEKNKIDFNVDIELFYKKMEPFIILVNCWSCVLGTLLSKCKDYKIRKNIVNNLFDENCDQYTHVETFYLFINECKNIYFSHEYQIDYNTINDLLKQENTQINSMLTVLELYVEEKSFEDGCQFLGAIEYVYHMISKDINEYFEKNKGIKPKFHYTVHEILDTKHASDLFDCTNMKNTDTDMNLLNGANWIINTINDLVNK